MEKNLWHKSGSSSEEPGGAETFPTGQRVIHSAPEQYLEITIVPLLQGTIRSRGSCSLVGPCLHAGKGKMNLCSSHSKLPDGNMGNLWFSISEG